MQKYICDFCGKDFFKYPSKIKGYNKHFCSNECRYKANCLNDEIYYENNYAFILLTKNNETKKVLFDIEDEEKIQQHKWHLHYRKRDKRYDCCTNTYGSHQTRKYINMPRFLLNYDGNLTIDHINRNSLDNRKCNLRIVTQFENNLNKGNNTSGCIGVVWDKSKNKWQVNLCNKIIGRYNTFEEAVKVRKEAENHHLQNNF